MDRGTREALRAFARRRWDLVEREKRALVAERYRTGGAAASRAAALRLLGRFRALHSDGPVPAMRAADLEAHVLLKRTLDTASHGFRR